MVFMANRAAEDNAFINIDGLLQDRSIPVR